jgi:thiamine-phosphate pyrophosphorylase
VRRPVIGRFCVVVDNVELAEAAISGGADVIQYRNKNASSRAMIEAASAVHEICAAAGVPLIVNDRIDVALAVEADGVHLGQDDLPVRVARELLGPSKVVGVSTSTYYEALRAGRDGADYLSCGHIFPTESKLKSYPARGVRFLAEVCRTVQTPVVAIGGITPANAAEVMRAGAFGIAVIGAVRNAANPREAANTLSQIIRTAAPAP